MLRTGFDRLRANGGGLENSKHCPFVLSSSKHEHHFFSALLGLAADRLAAKWPQLGGTAWLGFAAWPGKTRLLEVREDGLVARLAHGIILPNRH